MHALIVFNISTLIRKERQTDGHGSIGLVILINKRFLLPPTYSPTNLIFTTIVNIIKKSIELYIF